MMGQSGSVREPHFTLSFYHSRHIRPTGIAAEHFWRWGNDEFDAIIDSMGQQTTGSARMAALFREAMDIWLGELPSIPIHRALSGNARGCSSCCSYDPSAKDHSARACVSDQRLVRASGFSTFHGSPASHACRFSSDWVMKLSIVSTVE